MKQDKQENNDAVKVVEQDTLGPPDDHFYIDERLASQLKEFEGQSFLIGVNNIPFDKENVPDIICL